MTDHNMCKQTSEIETCTLHTPNMHKLANIPRLNGPCDNKIVHPLIVRDEL